MEAAECGVACLDMVLSYYGHHAPLAEIRQVCGSSRDGNSALDLLRCARQFGLQGRGLKLRAGTLQQLACPAILHWDMNHFVVLERALPDGATIVDPASGRRQVGLRELSELFSGVALELASSAAFQRRAARSLSYGRYRAALASSASPVAFVLLANLTAQFLALIPPAVTQILIDHIVVPNHRQWLIPVLAAMLFSLLARLVLTKIQGQSMLELQAKLGFDLTVELGARMLSLPLPFLEGRGRGDLLSRVRNQNDLQVLIAHTAQALFDPVSVLLLAGLMLAYDWRLGLVVLFMLGLRVSAIRLARSASEQRVAAELAARGREQSALLEATSSHELVKGMLLEGRVLGRYERRITERAAFGIRAERLSKGIASALLVLDALMEAVMLGYGGSRVIAGAMTVGVFAGFLSIRAMLQAPLSSLVLLFDNWIRFRGALLRSDEILAEAPVATGKLRPSAPIGQLEARNLSFRYGSGGSWVLRNVNLIAERGQKLVLLGPSGHGKSTLIKLLAGLLEPSEGEVLLDGLPITTYDRRLLAEHLGVVLQEPLILNGTLSEALALRIPNVNPSERQRATRLACFEEVVKRLPDGYESEVAALGTNLSGGERQRLALAQALVCAPSLLLLDEATCSLDTETEQRVLDNLDTLGATMISSAHRGAAISRAHRIFQVFDGKVSELRIESHARSSLGAPLPQPEPNLMSAP
jgi:ABC-type bacteriocin/lantibiotic exporter with double-glycine peptidase domain